MRFYDLVTKRLRAEGVSNCAGFVFHELGLEREDLYVGIEEAKTYLSEMKTSKQPVHRSVLVIRVPGSMHLALVEKQTDQLVARFRNGRGINIPVDTMLLDAFLSKITLPYTTEYKVSKLTKN